MKTIFISAWNSQSEKTIKSLNELDADRLIICVTDIKVARMLKANCSKQIELINIDRPLYSEEKNDEYHKCGELEAYESYSKNAHVLLQADRLILNKLQISEIYEKGQITFFYWINFIRQKNISFVFFQ